MDTSRHWDWDVGNALPSLILYQHRRDVALRPKGVPRPGRKTRTLLAFYLAQQRMALAEGGRLAGQLGRAAFLRGVIAECQVQATRLIETADTPEKRLEILSKVQQLHVLATRATAELKATIHE